MFEIIPSLDSFAGLTLLALIAFCDTLIGVGLFIFAEVAFLAAGAAFAASGTVWPALIVLVFAWLGDMTSYLIGARFGVRMSLPYLQAQKRRRAWRRARTALADRGAAFVVVSRFLGPVAWVTPFMAGAMRMPRFKFALAAGLGVMLGVGQFLIYGAIGQRFIGAVLPFIAAHIWVFALAFSTLLAAAYVWRRSEKPVWNRLIKVGVVSGAIFLTSNFAYFFVLNTHLVPTVPRLVVAHTCEATQAPFLVTPGDTSLHLPQPVNIMLISDRSGTDLMNELGWHQNATFSHNSVSFATYLGLLANQTPPVSELYLNGYPADSAHQMAGTIKNHEHIRWWAMGSGIHFGALSRDEEIAIKYYGHLPVLLHDIDPMVDLSRDMLAGQVWDSDQFEVVGIAPLAESVKEGEVSDFQTDGGVLVVTDKGRTLPESVMRCLNPAPFAKL
ncbi:LssY C-terminal domain-containing protein [Thalassobius sp. I31.1]|uniref:LssY C-terminal domain-containing protein n=1 Tax=Thalassobius sp. I31.1 TaxID=2109912 RepID=UPI000D199330|nr:LssY C-terminal domain-containing protein [Thalassobius sp. I31.1]